MWLNTTVFPPAIIEIELQMMVSVGFVVGVIAPITPNGQYSTKSDRDLLSELLLQDPLCGVFSAARRFLISLCSYFPIAVSSTAILEINSRFSRLKIVARIMSTYLWRSSILENKSVF